MQRSSRKFDSPRLRSIREKKMRQRRRIFLQFSILFGVLVVICIVLLNLRFTRFDQVLVTGNKVLIKEDVEDYVKENLHGRIAVILPKDSVIFYKRQVLEDLLKNRFSRIDSVKFYRNGHTLKVLIKEYEGSYLWCGESYSVDSGCYFLDSVGHIFDKSPYFSGSAYLKFYGPRGASKDQIIGSEFVDEKTFDNFLSSIDQLQYLGFKVTNFVVLEQNQVDATVLVGNHEAHVFLLVDDNYSKRINDLALAMTQKPLVDEKENNFSSLEYLDIRFDDKVYYKFIPTF